MKNTAITTSMLFTVMGIMSGTNSAAQQEVSGELTIKVSGFNEKSGNVLVHLFRPGDKVTGKPYKRVVHAIKSGTSIVKFKNIPFQNYYAMAVHDKNSNGVLDHNAMRIPSEPMGFSNNWNISLFSGMPNYKKTGFIFSKTKSTIKIRLK